MSQETLVLPKRQYASSHWLIATVAGVILAAFATAELVITYGYPIPGMAAHALILASLIGAASLLSEVNSDPGAVALSRLLYALTLVPLIRILSLSMPLIYFDPPYWYLMAGLPLSVAVLVVMVALGLSPRDVGIAFGRRLFLQPPVVALGFGLGISEYYILRPEPLIEGLTLHQFIVPALILLVATGFLEELVFRGVLQRIALPVLGPFLSVVYISAVFAILHIGYRSALDMAFVFAIALIYGWAVSKTGSIMGVSLSHGLINIMMFLVVPFITPLSTRGLPG